MGWLNAITQQIIKSEVFESDITKKEKKRSTKQTMAVEIINLVTGGYKKREQKQKPQ